MNEIEIFKELFLLLLMHYYGIFLNEHNKVTIFKIMLATR